MKCECGDPACPAHKPQLLGEPSCVRSATTLAFRIDMEDRDGTLMCRLCADDAAESGLFTFKPKVLRYPKKPRRVRG